MSGDIYGDPSVLNNPKLNGELIVAVQRNGQGDIEAFQLESGVVVTYDQAISYIKRNQADGLLVQQGNNGDLIIRSVPDAYTQNNLDNLPTFE